MTDSLSGIYAAMVTPYASDGHVSPDRAFALAQYLIKGGVDGILICGTTGEFPLLSCRERKEITAAVAAASGRVKLLTNVSSLCPGEILELIGQAQALDLAGISVVAPYYYCFDDDALFQFFSWVAAAADPLPVYLYNIPSHARNVISPRLLRRLAESCPNIRGVKDSSMDFMVFTEFQHAVGEDFSILTGNDAQILCALQNGGSGAVVASAGVFPSLVKGIYADYRAGLLEDAGRKQEQIYQFRQLCRRIMPGTAHKKALELLGFPMGPVRLPFRELSAKEIEVLYRGLEELNLLQTRTGPSDAR